MGIDIYMRWEGQTETEKKAQITGFDITKGGAGYLREAYHGKPYATQHLVTEAFDNAICDDDGYISISAKVLRARLPDTIKLAIKRQQDLYNDKVDESDPVIKSYIEFVELAERKEKETGKPIRIHASY